MTELWGAQGGSRMAEQDLQQAGVQDIGMMHTLGQIAMQPAQSRLLNAQAGGAEQKLANEQKLSTAMAAMAQGGGAPGGGMQSQQPLSSMFARLATTALGIGDPDKAAKYATVAGTLARQDTQNISTLANAKKAQLEAQHKQWDAFESLTRGVSDQAGLDTANANYESMTGMPSPGRGMQYSEENLTAIRNMAISRKDMLTAQLRADHEAEWKASHEARKDYQTARLEQIDAERKRKERADEAKAKNGGKPVGAPSKAEFTPALEMIQADVFPDGGGKEGVNLEQAKLAASDLASEAKRRTMANRGLDYATALHQAFEESKARGDWQDIKANGWFGKDSKKYAPLGARPETAIVIPADKKDMRAGRFYRNGNGAIAKWNGSKFVTEGSAPAALPGYKGAAVAPAPDETEDTALEEIE